MSEDNIQVNRITEKGIADELGENPFLLMSQDVTVDGVTKHCVKRVPPPVFLKGTPETVRVVNTEEESDLDVTDDRGFVLARFADGHIQTKNFDSRHSGAEEMILVQDEEPTEANNKIWLPTTIDEGTEVPTYEEFQALESETPAVRQPTGTVNSDLDITDDRGYVLARFADGHIKTKYFDSSNTGTGVEVKDTAAEADLFLTDDRGNVIAKLDGGHIKTKNFDSGDFADVQENVEALQEDVSGLQEDVTALQAASSGILARNRDTIDGVYAACHLRQYYTPTKQFCLLMGGDIHADWPRMASMIECLNGVDAFDAGIMLGDISDWLYTVTPYNDCIKNTERPFLTVLGNHDVVHGEERYETLADLYAKFIADNIQYADLESGEHPEGACYYYKDFSDYGIRLIVMNQYEYPADKSGGTFTYQGGDICYSQDQIDWFVDVLENTPSDYGVIIAGHTWFGRMTRDSSHILDASTVGAYSPHKLMDGYVVPEIVNAWINGQAYQHSYSYTPGGTWTTLTVDADFTSRGAGEFITYIGGHWHMSTLSTMTDYSDQHAYHVDCSGLPASTQGDTPRREGTKSEDAICALAVDRTAKKVKIFRIGAHFTMDGVDRQYGAYSYGT